MEVLKTLLFLVVLSIPLSLGGMAVVGGADGIYQDKRLVRVQRRKQEVCEWFVRGDLRQKWLPGIQSTSAGDQGRLEEGSTFREVYLREGQREERTWKVTACELPQRIAFETTFDGVPVTLSYTFQAHLSGKNTLVEVTYEATWEGTWNKIVEPVLAARVREEIGVQLEASKTAVDQSAAIF